MVAEFDRLDALPGKTPETVDAMQTVVDATERVTAAREALVAAATPEPQTRPRPRGGNMRHRVLQNAARMMQAAAEGRGLILAGTASRSKRRAGWRTS